MPTDKQWDAFLDALAGAVVEGRVEVVKVDALLCHKCLAGHYVHAGTPNRQNRRRCDNPACKHTISG